MPWLKSYPNDISWHADLPVASVNTLLDQSAAHYPQHPIIDFMGKIYSYRTIADQVDRMASGLWRMGVGPGSKVGLFLPNCPYFVIFYFAVLKTGATLVHFNPLYVTEEIRHQIEDSETTIMVTLDLAALLDKIRPLRGGNLLKKIIVCRFADCLPAGKKILFSLLRRRAMARWQPDDSLIPAADLSCDDSFDPPSIDPRTSIALLQYTGGTTGIPKGAMLSHANIVANAWQSVLICPQAKRGAERVLAVLPFFHSFAMTAVMNWSIVTGSQMILLPRYILKDLMKAIGRTKPTYIAGVPTIFNDIILSPDLARYDLSSLRFGISGGAPLPVEVKTEFERKTGCILVEGYGLSEASPVTCCNPFTGLNKPGSVGLPYPRTIAAILSVDAPHRILPPGERGEICFKGPQVMQGYWKRPDETAQTLRDGWLHTGDIGYMDEDGYVFVTDRIKELINASGFKVYPRIVEEALYQHPAVAECAVVGVPDPHRGQTVKAFIVRKPGTAVTDAELVQFLSTRLSPIEMPKLFVFRDSLPKSAIGKILKKLLIDNNEGALP